MDVSRSSFNGCGTMITSVEAVSNNMEKFWKFTTESKAAILLLLFFRKLVLILTFFARLGSARVIINTLSIRRGTGHLNWLCI